MVSFRQAVDFVFGQTNEQKLKRLLPILEEVNSLADRVRALSDAELRAKTDEFKARLSQGETLDDLLPEAFAVVREAAKRTIGLYPYDVQVLGGIVLHQRRIAEMKTGEGKTLVATMPAYLNALVGKVHIVTVNDYLARRDRHWMGPVYEFLGLKVGLIQEGMDPEERKAAYQADITYGTNAQFGFDYLRDHMVISEDQKVQGPLDYAIVDEIDYILIDEARTPLIISGPTKETARMFKEFARIARLFREGEDYEVDEEHRRLTLTDQGIAKAEKILKFENMFDPRATLALHHLETALRARVFFKRDRDYIVKDGRVIIVDEFTGRLMPDRRYSGGLHQAIEAKEGLTIQRESQTLAQITLQHYFRLYKGLSGMTGTAKTEESEFKEIYGLDVVQIPTNRPMIRQALPDVIYRTKKAKFEAVADEVERLHKEGFPVLIGTTSIEDSEQLSRLLKRRGLPHQVLNAKHHEREAQIVAQAGRLGAITIATNMAGRGTDILLGGNPEFRARQEADPDEEQEKYRELFEKYKKEAEEERARIVRKADPSSPYAKRCLAQIKKWCQETGRPFRPEEWKEGLYEGGLHVIGCQRHEARRIDDQLAGRAGRQGDPGSAQFFMSLEDDLLRIFGGERIASLMERLGVKEGEPITHDLLTRAIRRAQKRVEERNFEIRKRLLEYDEVMAKQREAIYALRERFLLPGDGKPPDVEELMGYLSEMIGEYAELLTERYAPPSSGPEAWDLEGLAKALARLSEPAPGPEALSQAKRWDALVERVREALVGQLERQRERLAPHFPIVARLVLLRVVDENWRQHLLELDDLKEVIGWRAYGGRDPLVEFKREAHRLFQEMLLRAEEEALTFLLSPKLSVRGAPPPPEAIPVGAAASTASAATPANPSPVSRHPSRQKKVGRNDPCPCGSGKKYKHCCGKDK
ncbi:TPA: preprotein translocase subunit SecA [Candidatus Acetothermia bacterium]|nr:preprotein translocase subunit SecA [Candidatus Acetothermia bacterium]